MLDMEGDGTTEHSVRLVPEVVFTAVQPNMTPVLHSMGVISE